MYRQFENNALLTLVRGAAIVPGKVFNFIQFDKYHPALMIITLSSLRYSYRN